MPSVASILLEIRGDSSDARKDLEDTARDLAAFGRETAEAGVQIETTEARNQLDELKARLSAFGSEDVTASANVTIAKALGELAALQLELDRIDGENVSVDVDVSRGVIERMTALGGVVEKLSADIGGDLTTAAEDGEREMTSFGSALGGITQLGPEVTGALALVAAVAIPALIGALFALAASAAAAVAGLGALAIAAGAALLPAIGLGIEAISRFKAQADTAGTAAHALKDAFSGVGPALSRALGPAADAVFRGLAATIKGIAPLIGQLRPAFTAFGQAVGKAFKAVGDQFKDPIWGLFFLQLLQAATQIAPLMASAFSSVANIFRNIASAALPSLISGLKSVSGALGGLSGSSVGINLGPVVSQLNSWLALIGQVGRAFLGMLKGAAGPGQQLVDWLTKGAKSLADWANSAKGQQEIKQFFVSTIPLVEQIVTLVAKLIVFFLNLSETAAPALAGIVGALSTMIGVASSVVGALRPIVAALVSVGSTVGVFAVVSAAIGLIGTALRAIPGIASSVWGRIKAIFSGGVHISVSISNAVVGVAKGIWGTVKGIFSGGVHIAVSIANAVVSAARTIFQTVKGIFAQGVRIAVSIASSVVSTAQSIFNHIKDIFSEVITLHISVPTPSLPHIPGLAVGAREFAGGVALVGENGPEIVNLPGGSDVFTAPDTRRILEKMASGVRSALIPNIAVSAPGAAAITAPAITGGGTNNHITVVAPPGESPDVESFVAQLDAKLRLGGL